MDYRDADWIVFHETRKTIVFSVFSSIHWWLAAHDNRKGLTMTQQGMSTKSRHLTIPDLITIGVFTALYFVLVAVATLFSSVALMGSA